MNSTYLTEANKSAMANFSQEDVSKLITTNVHKSKTFITALSVLLVVTQLHLVVIFYERNGSDKKRTLINKLFSSICRYVIVLNSSVQVATIFRLMVGPFSDN